MRRREESIRNLSLIRLRRSKTERFATYLVLCIISSLGTVGRGTEAFQSLAVPSLRRRCTVGTAVKGITPQRIPFRRPSDAYPSSRRCSETAPASSSSPAPGSTSTDPDAEIITLMRQAITDAGETAAWDECLAILVEAQLLEGASTSELELCLGQALGWKQWVGLSATFRKYQKKPTPPNAEALRGAVDWLRQGPLRLAEDPALLQTCVSRHPALYLADPERHYKRALESAPREVRTDPDAFRELVQKDPAVLQIYYNCDDGDDGCASNCGNCWVTFRRNL